MAVKFPERWTIGKLHLVIGSQRLWEASSLGWRRFHLGLFVVKSLPEEGARFGPEHYRGFWLKVAYWLPFEIET